MRNQIQSLRGLLTAPAGKATDAEAVQAEFRQAVSVIQHLASKGVIHKNQAARRVARLAAAVKAKASR
jgi:small subunit ribosomal protein S20